MEVTIKPPKLSTLTKEGWKTFKDAFERYVRCHPTVKLFGFLSSVQLKVLCARVSHRNIWRTRSDADRKTQGLKEKIEVETSSETISGDSTFNGSELTIPSGGGSLGSVSALPGVVALRSRLLVLKSTSTQPPRGNNFVYQLTSVKREDILDFCHKCLEMVKSDITMRLPTLGTLITSSVIGVLRIFTGEKLVEANDDPNYIRAALERIVGAYISQNAFESFAEEARKVICGTEEHGDVSKVTSDNISQYVKAWMDLVRRGGRETWSDGQMHLRRYGPYEDDDRKSVVCRDETLEGVFAYVQCQVGLSVGAGEKRRSSDSVGGMSDLDRDFKMQGSRSTHSTSGAVSEDISVEIEKIVSLIAQICH
ncbi:hypothetical protein ADUPG1_009291 [Aduncisulcus paluster]|uniref:Uncharacterized protein n=1 Tax=Aduncisulcus paluster TaxID=2918883 RepID=A0ABQ5KXB3_9EUKA|nr:hypothetical protein ADUPG1_009291 [Aduncisulcus paluster]